MTFAGLIFPEFIKKINANPPKEMFACKHFLDGELPSFGISFFCALVPVILMGLATISDFLFPSTSQFVIILKFIGDPGISMLIALILALILLGIVRGIKMKPLMDKASTALQAITTVLLLMLVVLSSKF